ncbi:MAG: hypothetical protein CM15mP49_02490 [Actinomycetota bacterium]|nr:MAG: hypothetical protein CM15mP49_02490 [Actinomycetota bacterium]
MNNSPKNAKSIWDKLSEWWIRASRMTNHQNMSKLLFHSRGNSHPEKLSLTSVPDRSNGSRGWKSHGACNNSRRRYSIRQLRHAKEVTSGIQFVQHSIEQMPFKNEQFDAVICSMVLEHLESLLEAVSEIARILERNGTLLIIMNHPVFQSLIAELLTSHSHDSEPIWGIGNYLTETSEIEKISSEIEVLYAHRTLSTYFNALSEENFMIENVIEKSLSSGLPGIPELLMILCRKVQ